MCLVRSGLYSSGLAVYTEYQCYLPHWPSRVQGVSFFNRRVNVPLFFTAININRDSRPVFIRWGISKECDSTLSSDKASWFPFHSLTGNLFLSRCKSRWYFAEHESETSTMEARTETDVEGKKSPQVISYIPKNS